MRMPDAIAEIAASLALAVAFAAHAEALNIDHAAALVVDAANDFRREHRLPALERNARLTDTAREFAEYMAKTDRLSHTADGREPAQRVQSHGYDYCMVAENIGYRFDSRGFASVEPLVHGFLDGWKPPPGHRPNLLDREALETGAGVARSPKSGRYYAVQLFGRRATKGHT